MISKKYLFLFLIVLCFNGYSQKVVKDTVAEVYTKGDWAFRFDIGSQFMQIHNNKVFFDYAQTIAYSLSYRGYYLNFRSFGEFKYKDEDLDISNNNISMGLGYSYDLSPKWGADGFINYNISSYISTKEDYNTTEDAVEYEGVLLGLKLNRYFKLVRNNYLVLSANLNYVWNISYNDYGSSYEPKRDYLDNYNYPSFGISVAYKGWFRKRIK